MSPSTKARQGAPPRISKTPGLPSAAKARIVESAWSGGTLRRGGGAASAKARIDEAIEIMAANNVSDKEAIAAHLEENGYHDAAVGHRGVDLLRRPNLTYREIAKGMPELSAYHFDDSEVLALETKVKYEGYIKKAIHDAERNHRLENYRLPEGLDYLHMDGLRLEARQKLSQVQPRTIGQASRVSGVNPADISVLILVLKKEGLL